MADLDYITIAIWPVEPTCCPDAYMCFGGAKPETECRRHGGFDVCCDQPFRHIPQDREAWHRQMDRWEQNLLNRHIQRYKILQTFELESSLYASTLSSNI